MATPSIASADASLRRLLSAPIALHLLDTPLDYIFAEHMRLRAVCARLRQFAEDGLLDCADADLIRRHLEIDLADHCLDEERDLFPLLQKYARGVDDLQDTLAQLAIDHQQMQAMQGDVLKVLDHGANARAVALTEADGAVLNRYAELEQRHIAIEDGIVLAIARIRLSPRHLAEMTTSMKARRGLQA